MSISSNRTTLNLNSSLRNNSLAASLLGDSATIRGIKATAYLILLLMSVMGNSLVIAVVHRKRELRTTINYLIANMAVSDVLFPLVTVPLDVTKILSGDPQQWLIKGGLGSFFCKLIPYTIDVSIIVSVFSMLAIAFERFRAVVFPLKKAIIPKSRCALIIGLIWVLSGVINFPNLYRYRLIYDKVGNLRCVTEWKPLVETMKGDTMLWLVNFSCFILLPLAIISVLYLVIFLTLRKQDSLRSRQLATGNRKQKRSASPKLNSMLVAVVVAFAITWLPLGIFYTLLLLGVVPFTPDKASLIFGLLYFTRIYQILNPIIYFVFNRAYRQGLNEIVSSKSFSSQLSRASAWALSLTRSRSNRNIRPEAADNNRNIELKNLAAAEQA